MAPLKPFLIPYLAFVIIYLLLGTYAAPLSTATPGDPATLLPLDWTGDPADTSIHIGISNDLLNTFKLVSQFAAAAYCPDNNDSPDTTLTCATGNCPLVEAAGAVTLSEFEDTPHFDDTGYIAVDDTNKIVVLAIRGSVSKKNWHADWDMIRTKINFCHECHVHRGFKNSWEEVKDAVIGNMQKAVELHPDYRIVVTGHSLGAAVATLAAGELRRIDDHFKDATELYTFGSPRLANREAARWLSEQSRLSWRITNQDDLVPRLPPRVFGYHHTEPEYWMSKNGDDPATEDIQWANREDSSWGNEGEIVPKRSAHHHYFGPIGACSGDSDDRASSVPDRLPPAGNASVDEWQR
ncbi:MAG: hypothetical protein LQ338_005909 [Usnochroma carphineum]|nr:MAG: hypothetical protein LQ338_005909 [Usnochroma carphineum]